MRKSMRFAQGGRPPGPGAPVAALPCFTVTAGRHATSGSDFFLCIAELPSTWADREGGIVERINIGRILLYT